MVAFVPLLGKYRTSRGRDQVEPIPPPKQKRRPELGGVLIRSAEVVEGDITPTSRNFQFL
jgi:hypothetical protein